MKFQRWMASVLVALGVSSCGENAQVGSEAQKPIFTSSSVQQSRSAPQPRIAGNQSTPLRARVDDAPVPPVDAQWTIYCDSVDGPAHVENARDLKAILTKASGMTGWYVIHGEKESTIYFGFYRSLDNPAEKQRAEADRARIGTIADRLGNRIVRGSVLVPVAGPDPQAPSDWNLANAPRNAYWTIEVATFSGNPKRKEAAVQAVRELREKGEKEAYYYHGATVSSVCIGAWPRGAVKEQGTGIDKNGNARDDVHSTDPTQPLLVIDGLAPSNISSDVRDPATGKRMLVEAKKLEINDPDMKRKTQEYPYHYVNYELRGKQSGDQVFPDQSVLVVIPRDQPGGDDENWRLTGGASPSPAPRDGAAPRGPASPGDDALRSIGK